MPLRPDGFGRVAPTPGHLVDRALATPPLLPPPGGSGFVSQVTPVPADVAARSTWSDRCPVRLDDLRYVQVSFWGFDGRHHLGELLVAGEVADDVVAVFGRLHEVRFPIEEMRVVRADELGAPPTGDGNVTTGFVCRTAVGSESWSRHSLGLAVDLNPFHNPYLRGDLVLPELASAYLAREREAPGMVTAEVVDAFASVGWEWGGDWRSRKDWMHFSVDGR